MMSTTGLFDDLDTDSRAKERNLGIILALPAFFGILLPLLYFVAMSVWTGRDEFGPLRDFLNHYHIAVILPMIVCCASLAMSLYLILVKGILAAFSRLPAYEEPYRYDADDVSTPADDNRRRLASFVVAALLTLAAIMFFWNS